MKKKILAAVIFFVSSVLFVAGLAGLAAMASDYALGLIISLVPQFQYAIAREAAILLAAILTIAGVWLHWNGNR
ncbi:hypothetical protein HY798_04945 [Candidatus Falkowbacteria bacterium]|nr:hypothetical protein [Candidatus Falkowbacteria bacterium]